MYSGRSFSEMHTLLMGSLQIDFLAWHLCAASQDVGSRLSPTSSYLSQNPVMQTHREAFAPSVKNIPARDYRNSKIEVKTDFVSCRVVI